MRNLSRARAGSDRPGAHWPATTHRLAGDFGDTLNRRTGILPPAGIKDAAEAGRYGKTERPTPPCGGGAPYRRACAPRADRNCNFS